jgi:hypothetical protein
MSPEPPPLPHPATPAPAVAAVAPPPALLPSPAHCCWPPPGLRRLVGVRARHHEPPTTPTCRRRWCRSRRRSAAPCWRCWSTTPTIVKAGQPLVRLDPADAQLALGRAEAQLAQTVREVRTLYANNATLAPTSVPARGRTGARCRPTGARQDDVARRQPLLASGAVGGEEMKHAEATLAGARSALAGAQSALAAAREQALSQPALTDGTQRRAAPQRERAAAACARPSWRCSAPSCRRRWPARWRGAPCRSASAWPRARR